MIILISVQLPFCLLRTKHMKWKTYVFLKISTPKEFRGCLNFDVWDLHLKLSDEFNFDPLLLLLRLLSPPPLDVMSWAVKLITTVHIHCIVCNLFLKSFHCIVKIYWYFCVFFIQLVYWIFYVVTYIFSCWLYFPFFQNILVLRLLWFTLLQSRTVLT